MLMDVVRRLVRLAVLMAIAAAMALVVVIAVAIAGQAMGMMEAGAWFGHSGFYILPWAVFTILCLVPLAVLDEKRELRRLERRRSIGNPSD